jgi:hypothetical protein
MRTRQCSGIGIAACFLLLSTMGQGASARDGSSLSHVRGSSGFSSPTRVGTHGGWHRGHRGRGAGVYLDRDRGSFVNVTVRQTVVAAPAAFPAYSIPSLTDLPAVAGIRKAAASEPAVYVLNERNPAETTGSLSSRRTVGPRIMHALPDGSWDKPSDAPLGARIINLTVPVGSSR